MLARIDSAELSEWMAYSAIEPFGEQRADLRAGIIAATLANIHRKKGARPFKPADFMAFQEKPQQTVKQQLAIFDRIQKALNRKKRGAM